MIHWFFQLKYSDRRQYKLRLHLASLSHTLGRNLGPERERQLVKVMQWIWSRSRTNTWACWVPPLVNASCWKPGGRERSSPTHYVYRDRMPYTPEYSAQRVLPIIVSNWLLTPPQDLTLKAMAPTALLSHQDLAHNKWSLNICPMKIRMNRET